MPTAPTPRRSPHRAHSYTIRRSAVRRDGQQFWVWRIYRDGTLVAASARRYPTLTDCNTALLALRGLLVAAKGLDG